MFLPDIETALNRILRILVPNGRFAAAVWDIPQSVPLISLSFGIAHKMFNLQHPPPGTPSIFGLANNALELALTRAGFSDVHTETLTVTFEFASMDTFIQYYKDTAAPVVALLKDKTAAQQEEFWKELAEAAGQYSSAIGLRIPNTAVCAVGMKQTL